jgi:hypothetical protein
MASDLRRDSLLSSSDRRIRDDSGGPAAHEAGLEGFGRTGVGGAAWTVSGFGADVPMKERRKRLALLFEPASFPKKMETLRRALLAAFLLGASADTREMWIRWGRSARL